MRVSLLFAKWRAKEMMLTKQEIETLYDLVANDFNEKTRVLYPSLEIESVNCLLLKLGTELRGIETVEQRLNK